MLHVDENVYEPSDDSFLLAENLDVREEDIVLDVGTGCGMLGILAAKTAKKVVAVDINPYAIRCAKKNAKLNSVNQKMDFLQCDLLTPFRPNGLFSLITFNAPYLPLKLEKKKAWIDLSWAGGSKGREVIDRLITQVPDYLAEDGRVLLVQSSLANVKRTVQRLKEKNFEPKIIAKRKIPFETLAVIKASRRKQQKF